MSNILEQEPSLLPPKLDVVFQALFGEVGSEAITTKFLEAILQQKINSIDLSQNIVLRRNYPKDKLGVLDIIAKINDGEYCNIEMQVAEQEEIKERILYYWGRVYTKQIKAGQSYDSLQKTIVILITNFCVKGLEDLEYHTSWKIIEEKYRKIILTNKLDFHIIELPKIMEGSNENDNLLDWLFFLDNPKCERVITKMKKNKELKQASDKLETLSQDEKLQRLAEWREKAIYEYNTATNTGFKNGMRRGLEEGRELGMKEGMEEGIKQGIEQGVEQGIQQGMKQGIEKGIEQGILKDKQETALELLKNNLDVEFVHKITKLSIEEIEQLKQSLEH